MLVRVLYDKSYIGFFFNFKCVCGQLEFEYRTALRLSLVRRVTAPVVTMLQVVASPMNN